MTEAATPLRHRRPWLFGLAAALLVLLFAGLGYWWHSRSAHARQYVTVAADLGTVAPTVTASGTLNPETTVQVGSYVSGVIQRLSCDYNTRVQAGQLCANIDPRPYQTVVDQEAAALATARAQLEKDRAALDLAKATYARNVDLAARDFISKEVVDTAYDSLEQAQSQITLDQASVKQHVAQLEAARINLGYTRIVSPVDGTVVSRNVTQGQTVAASFQTPTLFLIATDLTRMQVDTNVSESDIGSIQEGNPARFTVEAFRDRAFEGRVKQVRQAPQTVQNVITYDVVVSVANPEMLLKPGMTASIHIVTAQHDHVLRVPDQALRYIPTAGTARKPAHAASGPASAALRGTHQAQVWTLVLGQPQPVPLLIGLDDDSYSEVLGGDLQAGMPLVVSERSGQAARSEAAPAGSAQAGPRLPRF